MRILNKKCYLCAQPAHTLALILEKADNKIMKLVVGAKPQKVITLDRLFKNNDQLKTNTALQMKDVEIEFKVV